MPTTLPSSQGHSTQMPATSGWLLLSVLLTGMLLLGHWFKPLPTAAPATAQAPAAAPAPQPQPATPTVALGNSSRPYSLPRPVLTATRF